MNENYGINSDSMLDAASRAGQVSNQITDAGSSMASEFSKTSKLNGQSVGEISKQLSILGSSTSSWQKIITTNVNKGLDYDSRMSQVADDIEVPLDYTTNNTMDTNKYHVVFISKMDGRSITDGKQAEKINDIDDSTIAAQGLTNINQDQTKLQNYDDSTTIRGESILANINNNKTEQQDYDDSTSVGNKKLKDISGDQAQEQKYDSSSVVSNKNLYDMSGNQTQEQNYDGSSSVVNQNLTNISKDNTEMNNYDGSTSISGQSILGNINQDNKSQMQALNDEVIAAAVQNGELHDIKSENKTEEDDSRLNDSYTTVDGKELRDMQNKEE